MSAIAMDIARMVDMLPESDQQFAREFVKKLCWPGIPTSPKPHRKRPHRCRRRKQAALSRKMKSTGTT